MSYVAKGEGGSQLNSRSEVPSSLEISELPTFGPTVRTITDAEYPPVVSVPQRLRIGAGAGGAGPLHEQPCVLARGLGSAPFPLK